MSGDSRMNVYRGINISLLEGIELPLYLDISMGYWFLRLKLNLFIAEYQVAEK